MTYYSFIHFNICFSHNWGRSMFFHVGENVATLYMYHPVQTTLFLKGWSDPGGIDPKITFQCVLYLWALKLCYPTTLFLLRWKWFIYELWFIWLLVRGCPMSIYYVITDGGGVWPNDYRLHIVADQTAAFHTIFYLYIKQDQIELERSASFQCSMFNVHVQCSVYCLLERLRELRVWKRNRISLESEKE